MKVETLAKLIKDAFFEGYNSYESPCCPYNDVESAWENSEAKEAFDEIKENANGL